MCFFPPCKSDILCTPYSSNNYKYDKCNIWRAAHGEIMGGRIESIEQVHQNVNVMDMPECKRDFFQRYKHQNSEKTHRTTDYKSSLKILFSIMSKFCMM